MQPPTICEDLTNCRVIPSILKDKYAAREIAQYSKLDDFWTYWEISAYLFSIIHVMTYGFEDVTISPILLCQFAPLIIVPFIVTLKVHIFIRRLWTHLIKLMVCWIIILSTCLMYWHCILFPVYILFLAVWDGSVDQQAPKWAFQLQRLKVFLVELQARASRQEFDSICSLQQIVYRLTVCLLQCRCSADAFTVRRCLGKLFTALECIKQALSSKCSAITELGKIVVFCMVKRTQTKSKGWSDERTSVSTEAYKFNLFRHTSQSLMAACIHRLLNLGSWHSSLRLSQSAMRCLPSFSSSLCLFFGVLLELEAPLCRKRSLSRIFALCLVSHVSQVFASPVCRRTQALSQFA